MNSNLNATVQFSNDADIFAYRGQASRLRSQAVRQFFASIASRLHLVSAR